MKILLTTDPEIPVPPPLYGGAERLASDLIDEYVSLGHEVYLMANSASQKNNLSGFFPWEADSSVGFSNVVKNAWQLRKVYGKVKPDVVHCFSRLLYIYPTLFTTNARFVKRYGRFISIKATTLAKNLAGDRLQLVAAAKHMLNHLPDKSAWKVIYNFVDTDFYTDSETTQRDGLLFLGRIEDIKGVNEAIRVAQIVGEKLTIAGNIEREHQHYFNSKVKPHLNEKISFLGPVNNEQKRSLFRSSRATLFPIKWEEPFGIVMAESISCGTPVIAFRRGSVPEVIQDGVNGFVVDNVEEMVGAARRINSIDRQEVRNIALKKFSRRNAALAYVALFDQMINP